MNPIFKRKSIRKFKNKEVEDEKVERLLKAGMQAPSAMNSQPWEFLVVTDKENIKKNRKYEPILKTGKNIHTMHHHTIQ